MIRTLVVLLLCCSNSFAAEYRIEVIDEPPPKKQLSKEVAESLSDKGIAVIRDSDRRVAEFWFPKKWSVQEKFSPTFQVLYPFTPGQFVGVVRYPRKGGDFRDQEISRGIYTLRYGLQPVDGNHVGTSDTRDFLLLLPAEHDKSIKPIKPDDLVEPSTEVSESSHPALLGLQPAEKDVEKLPALKHDEQRDWWIAQFSHPAMAGDKEQKLRMDLVVIGFAEE